MPRTEYSEHFPITWLHTEFSVEFSIQVSQNCHNSGIFHTKFYLFHHTAITGMFLESFLRNITHTLRKYRASLNKYLHYMHSTLRNQTSTILVIVSELNAYKVIKAFTVAYTTYFICLFSYV